MRYFFVSIVLFWAGIAHGQSGVENDVQAGDVIFHRSRSAQSRIIRQVTNSPWTHVGVVFEREGALWVLEAVQPVKWTALQTWVRRGRGAEYTIRRPRAALSGDALNTLREHGERFLGRRYDTRFEWDERRIYCSELVWLMFEQALGVRLSEPQRWRDLTLSRAARRLARQRLGRLPPPEALIVTPAALLDSTALFDPRAPE
ncbi:MAG: hypothetical protein ACI9KE_001663 [Polyangiales bacterium]|jgi:hypothetical protein